VTRFRVGPTDKQLSLHFFSSESRGYHRRAERGWLQPLRARERRAVADLARFDDCSGSVIDVGCGTGVHALAAKAAGLRVTAVDVSIWAVEGIRGKVDAAFVADIEHLNASGAYEVVLCLGVLDYVAEPASAFRNLCALVGLAGRLVVQVPRVGIGGSLHALIAKRSSGLDVNLFTVAWLAREARRWGLELMHTRRPLPHNLVAVFRRPVEPTGSPPS
jgi:2-polyprenyl-3-methyl-5-hydroxy-6-metoxy-1,4-benzoquinol methylase